MSKEITEADFINLANKCVGEGLLRTGEANFELAKEYAKEKSIEFFKWNASKVSEYLDFLRRVDKAEGVSEMELELDNFENATIEKRYNLFINKTK